MILVSSCLLGINSKYNGSSNRHELLMQYCKEGKFIPFCPEQLGGLPTPRVPVEIHLGLGADVLSGVAKVLAKDDRDYSKEFIKGAEESLQMALNWPIKAAILKERSPSCGVTEIYDGTFQGTLRSGRGVTASILEQNNIPIYSEEQLTEELLQKLLKD